MKLYKPLAVISILILLLAIAVPAFAQLGDSDVSSFTVQNVSSSTASVTVRFVDEAGVTTTPTSLGAGITNPFNLAPGASTLVYVPNIPDLPSGRYSVVIESDYQVIAIASVAGTGTRRFTGNYTGFSSGATTFYLPSFANNYFGWYSLISVQNLGDAPADITVDVKCSNAALTGTLQALNVPSLASHTFILKDPSVFPAGFPSDSSACVGSAKITADQPVVATDSQSKPANGNTNSFNGEPAGATKLFVPALTNNYFSWNHSLNIVKLSPGNLTVTVDYSDSAPNSTCNLTDAVPGCQLYMPTAHSSATGIFGATVTAPGDILAVATSTKGNLSSAYNAISGGSSTAFIPTVTKAYYNWNSSWTCQNVGTVATQIHVVYQNFAGNAYNHPNSLDPGEVQQVYVPNEGFLPNGYSGGATISAVAGGAVIACIVDSTNATWSLPATPGDWTQGYNAFSQ